MNLKLKVVLIFFAYFFVMGVLFFWPAGTVYWPEAWAYLVFQLVASGYITSWLFKHDPKLLVDRLTKHIPVKGWDKLVVLGFIIAFIPMIIIPGLDYRHNWSVVPLWLETASFVLMALSYYVVFLVMKENTFLLRIVKVQKGHKVIATGPYSVVRHPMYASVGVFMLSWPLVLGSFYGLIPAFAMLVILLVRTKLEDDYLKKGLKGYRAYARKVKYRLLPGVW